MIPLQSEIKMLTKGATTPELKSVVTRATKRAEQFLVAYNRAAYENGQQKLEMTKQTFQDSIVDLYTSNSTPTFTKALLNGGTAATGLGLQSAEYNNELDISMFKGGSFRSAGTRIRTNQIGTYYPGSGTASRKSGFSTSVPTVAGAGDVAPILKNLPVTMTQYNALVPVDRVWANSFAGGLTELYLAFEQMLQEKKLLLEDELLATNVTTAANGVQFVAPSAASYGKIHDRLITAIGRLSGYGMVEIFLNQIGLAALLGERDANGQPINISGVQFNPLPGLAINSTDVGRVGAFGVNPVFINNGINDDYLITDSTGAITAQTGTPVGGTSHLGTAILVRVRGTGEIAYGQSEFDQIRYFGSRDGSLSDFFASSDSIGAVTLMGASAVNNDRWQVIAL